MELLVYLTDNRRHYTLAYIMGILHVQRSKCVKLIQINKLK